MNISFDLVVAMDLNSGIGKNGRLPWHLPADLKHFKKLTTTTHDPLKKNLVVMGRKTWESLPAQFRPLPDRINAVLTTNQNFNLPRDVLRCDSFPSFVKLVTGMRNQFEKIFVIGGAKVFEQAVNHPGCHKIYVTKVLKTFDCDTFFPPINLPWQEVRKSEELSDQSLPYCFIEYKKA